MNSLPRTMSAGWQAGVSRFGVNPRITHDFNRSLTYAEQKCTVNLASSRKWGRKVLWFNRKSGPQSPRSRDRGAD